MNEKHSLLDKIKSKYIIKKILMLAFPNMNSVLKFIAYDKNLINKLEINIKDYFDYETKEIIIKGIKHLIIQTSINTFILFVPFLVFYIKLYSKRIFKKNNLITGHNKKKKFFLKIFDYFFILLFIIYLIISLILSILFAINKKRVFNKKDILKFEIFNFFIFLFYIIINTLKYCYIFDVIEIKSLSKNKWYPEFSIGLSSILVISLINNLVYLIGKCSSEDNNFDLKSINLHQINGIDINVFNLPPNFDNLDKRDKNKFIFEKENMKKYRYALDNFQHQLIKKINQPRNQNNIKELKYDVIQQLPDYIINKKTELTFYKEQSIYKFPNDFYLIKFPISEKIEINDVNMINIIKMDFLDSINIIRKDNYEYISIYNNNFTENNISIKEEIVPNKVNPNLNPRIILPFKFFDIDDKLNENKREKNLSETRRVGVQDNDKSENIIFVNMEKNINSFEKLEFKK